MSTPYPRHLAFPFRIGSDGRTANTPSLEAHIRDELIQLLLTNLGERAFVPAFGGDVRRLVFEPASEALLGMTKAQLTQAISTWLGHRITLEDLRVTLENSTIDVEIQYRIIETDESRVIKFQRTESQP